MQKQNINQSHAPTVIIDGATTAGAVPGSSSALYRTTQGTVTTFINAGGSGTLQLWLHDGEEWYKGDVFDFPAENIAVSWTIPSSYFTFQLTSIDAGPVTVKAL